MDFLFYFLFKLIIQSTKVYKILKVFEKNLDVEEPDWEDLTPQKLNISEVLWQNLIQMLIKAGYIDGIKITSTATGTYITPINPQITLQGLQYLEENSMMRKAYRLAKGIKDITPGINIVNQARVTACFFYCPGEGTIQGGGP